MDYAKKYAHLFSPDATYIAFGTIATFVGDIPFWDTFHGTRYKHPFWGYGGDYPSVEVYTENSRLLFDSSEIEGISHYEVRKLTPEGETFLKGNPDLSDEEKVKAISEIERYTESLF